VEKIKLGEVLPALLLYVISVYQPCDESLIMKVLREARGSENLPQKRKASSFTQSLGWLLENELIRKAQNGEYIVTRKGIIFLGKQRLAFPRDKYRLYFLHKLTNSRSQ